jgi:hypothetical protein
MRRTFQFVATLAAAGLSLCPVACGNKYVTEIRLPETGATLEGTVSYGGTKVLVALVIAQGPNGAATGFIGDDGRFKLENVPLGEVNIAVNTDAGKGQLMSKIMAQSQGKARGGPPRVTEVPQKYADPGRSGIKTTINPGANTFDIVIPR